MSPTISLEPAAEKFCQDTAKPPFLFDLGPEKGRATVDEVQSSTIPLPAVETVDIKVAQSAGGMVSVRIIRPTQAAKSLPTVLYLHGAGWVFGNAHTHDRLVRELAIGANAAVVFPEYSLSPEARYPTALEECYSVLKWVSTAGAEQGLDPKRIVVAGDSVGGNLATAVALLAKQHKGPALRGQLLFYPVTNADFDTASYREFATGYFLRRDAMQWFWDQYTTDPAQRAEITASPLRATTADLADLPPALVITAEADVLRDEGEAYANLLRQAGVAVTAARFQGIIHDFVMLNALAHTQAARGAMTLATGWLRDRCEEFV